MALCVGYLVMFFFQAEDGIRDLVRSRGLGDVYKRQDLIRAAMKEYGGNIALVSRQLRISRSTIYRRMKAVSYTHLTLPTSDLV